jgi:ferritin-like metal-binding protein YciE
MHKTSMHDLFAQELRDLYSAENQIVKALPKMARAAADPELRHAFQDHLEETTAQIGRLEQICAKMEISPKGRKCKAMEGLLEESKEALEFDRDSVRDAALIAAVQRIEHYEIAGYGCARTFAEILGNDQAAHLLQESLAEEGIADKRLTYIAETINMAAVGKEHDFAQMAGSGMAHAGHMRH